MTYESKLRLKGMCKVSMVSFVHLCAFVVDEVKCWNTNNAT